jgi:hypothetical protein
VRAIAARLIFERRTRADTCGRTGIDTRLQTN